MSPLREAFDERLGEITTYVKFLVALEAETRNGTPRLGAAGPAITVAQQRILYSSVYLQLYNLVEATITRCLNGVCDAAVSSGRWRPGDLSEEMRREWVRYTARTHTPLNDDKRLRHALGLVEQLVSALPVSNFRVEKAGGSWDDILIEKIAARIGLQLIVSVDARTGVKRKLRDDKGALELIAGLRNDLAHGSLSFVQCGENAVVADLIELRDCAAKYLGEVVDAFQAWIEAYEFLLPDRRPSPAAMT